MTYLVYVCVILYSMQILQLKCSSVRMWNCTYQHALSALLFTVKLSVDLNDLKKKFLIEILVGN